MRQHLLLVCQRRPLLLMMPIFGHVGLALATSLSGLIAAIAMAVLLHRRGRLGGGSLGMIGRIFLASLVMAILLLAMVSLAGGIRQLLPAAGWLACLVVVGGGGFLVAAWCFRAIPAGFVRRFGNRKT